MTRSAGAPGRPSPGPAHPKEFAFRKIIVQDYGGVTGDASFTLVDKQEHALARIENRHARA